MVLVISAFLFFWDFSLGDCISIPGSWHNLRLSFRLEAPLALPPVATQGKKALIFTSIRQAIFLLTDLLSSGAGSWSQSVSLH